VELVPADDMKVRVLQPPPRSTTRATQALQCEELKELKGTSNLPGYTAELNGLQQGQIVQVYLASRPPSQGGQGERKDKDALADDRPSSR